MKKTYIFPAIKMGEIATVELLSESVPGSETTVPGGDALGKEAFDDEPETEAKGSVWDD